MPVCGVDADAGTRRASRDGVSRLWTIHRFTNDGDLWRRRLRPAADRLESRDGYFDCHTGPASRLDGAGRCAAQRCAGVDSR